MRAALVVAFAALPIAPLAAAPGAPPPYAANCQVCHRADGSGLPGQFPRIAGRANIVAGKPAGRAYLIDVALYGIAGKMMVDGKPIMGVMPPFARLADADIATILTYATRLPGGTAKVAPFTPAEIKAARAGPRKANAAMKATRDELVAAGVIP